MKNNTILGTFSFSTANLLTHVIDVGFARSQFNNRAIRRRYYSITRFLIFHFCMTVRDAYTIIVFRAKTKSALHNEVICRFRCVSFVKPFHCVAFWCDNLIALSTPFYKSSGCQHVEPQAFCFL